MQFPGSCHCGNITFSLTVQPAPTELRASACSCSFCTKHGAVWTAHPSGSLKVHVKEPALVSKPSPPRPPNSTSARAAASLR